MELWLGLMSSQEGACRLLITHVSCAEHMRGSTVVNSGSDTTNLSVIEDIRAFQSLDLPLLPSGELRQLL
jgi:hypothetical protein